MPDVVAPRAGVCSECWFENCQGCSGGSCAHVARGHYEPERAQKHWEEAFEAGRLAGLQQADSAINWQTSCLGCADRLDDSIRERSAGYDEGYAEGSDAGRLAGHQVARLLLGDVIGGLRERADEVEVVAQGLFGEEKSRSVAELVARAPDSPGGDQHP